MYLAVFSLTEQENLQMKIKNIELLSANVRF